MQLNAKLFLACGIVLCCVLPNDTVSAATIDIPIAEDTYVEEKYPDVAPWNNRNLYVGTDSWYAKGKTRILILPDFSTLQENHIGNSNIEKVELLMTTYAYEGTDDIAVIDTYTTTSPWGMSSVTWNSQPSISTKKDTSQISTSAGRKSILVTQGFLYALGTFPTSHRGLLLKINAETEKALIFWGHGCDIAPSPPICGSIADRPYFRVTYSENKPPGVCTLKSPVTKSYNSDTIEIARNPVIDPDNDVISYAGRICSESTCAEPVWQSDLTDPLTLSTVLYDGQYYASCQASDNFHEGEWGSAIAFTIDTTPPAIPQMIDEPSFTATMTNTITWLLGSEQGQSYQVLASERSDFRSYNTYSAWTSENRITFTHTKEKTFYYKIKTKDLAGNESLWSSPTSTTIDTSMPSIKYFKTNKMLFAPKFDKSGNATESAYIQGGVDDANINQLEIQIRNTKNQTVFSIKESEKSYLWIHWPNKAGYPDGTYIAQLIAEDAVGNVMQSEPILLTLDSTPPPQPQFFGIANNQAFTRQTFPIEARCKENSVLTVTLSGKTIAYGKSIHSIKVTKTDGSYTLSATCADLAGNKSSLSIKFSVDTTPPATPTITYAFDREKKILVLSSYCREDGALQLYKSGILLQQIPCAKGKYARYTYPESIELPFKATFTARSSDSLGNLSASAEKTVHLAELESDSDAAPAVSCAALFQSSTKTMTSFSCNATEQSILEYKSTTQTNKTSYSSKFTVNFDTQAKVALTIIACKKKSLWDPRTWYSCVSYVAFETNLKAKVIPIFTSQQAINNIDEQALQLTHPKSDTISIDEKLYIHFSTIWAETPIIYDYFSPLQSRSYTPKYPTTSTPNAYFTWIFDGARNASQWHGNTAYQRPHGGIDFSVSGEQIYAPAKGSVASSGYHQSSKCYGGGNYLGIKHPNGLYTYYFHLASTNFPNGKKISVDAEINAGDKLSKTGSTGMYNCEKLAAHLHFEVRTSGDPKNHVNPVPYFNIDWNSIRTANAVKYPGRLTGDNPHPKF